jgi:hypothetical protein
MNKKSPMDDRLEQNKKTAISFYDLMFNQCKPAEAIERYAGDTYIQHNPHVADGKEAFISYFNRWPRSTQGSESTSRGLLPKTTTSFCTVNRSGLASKTETGLALTSSGLTIPGGSLSTGMCCK